MTIVAWTFALLSAVVYLLAFVWESVLFTRPGVHRGVFFVPTEDVPAIRLWAFGVGFYNLALAAGAVTGVIAWIRGAETVGRTLVVFVTLTMVLGGAVLVVADRLAMGRPRGKGLGGALGAGVPPLVALVATLA
jgi:putative membrane protein